MLFESHDVKPNEGYVEHIGKCYQELINEILQDDAVLVCFDVQMVFQFGCVTSQWSIYVLVQQICEDYVQYYYEDRFVGVGIEDTPSFSHLSNSLPVQQFVRWVDEATSI